MLKFTKLNAILLAMIVGLSVSCKEEEKKDEMEEPALTLYDRVGGTAMVSDPVNGGEIQQGRLTLRSVVDSAIFVIAADTRLQPYFTTLLGEVGNGDLSGFAALSESLTDFFVVATSEEQEGQYTGLNMVDAHNPDVNSRMDGRADDAAMDAFIEDVGVSLGKNGVSDQELIGDLVDLLESVRSAVVQE